MAQPVYPLPASPTLLTVEEFMQLDLPPGYCKAELVRGEVRLVPAPGAPHGRVCTNIAVLLSNYVLEHGLGDVFGDNVPYELIDLPHTVRTPDTTFVRAGRIPAEGVPPGPLRLAPDLIVEVVSPSETTSRLEEKLYDYAACGTEMVWLVDLETRTVTVISRDAPIRTLTEDDTLDGGSVIPGFSCSVAAVFERVAR